MEPSVSIDNLTSSEACRLRELLEAIRAPVEEWVAPDSDLLGKVGAEEFRSRLLTQHLFLGSPLFQDTFDRALAESISVGGHVVGVAPDGERFWDLLIDGARVSLKSSKAKALRKGYLAVSKLTEAAWIQDCRSARQRKAEIDRLFEAYLGKVDRILQLRYFAKESFYELVEIPTDLLRPIFDAPLSSFSADGPSIGIPVGQEPPNLIVKIDRSDAKITLNAIRKDVCFVHATWQLVGFVRRRS